MGGAGPPQPRGAPPPPPPRNRRNDADFIAVFKHRLFVFEEADVLLVDIDVDEAAHLALVIHEAFLDAGEARLQFDERLADGGGVDFDQLLVVGQLAERRGDSDFFWHKFNFNFLVQPFYSSSNGLNPAMRKCLSVASASTSRNSFITTKLAQSVNENSWSRCFSMNVRAAAKRSGVIHSMLNASDVSVIRRNSFKCFVNPRARNSVAVSSKT